MLGFWTVSAITLDIDSSPSSFDTVVKVKSIGFYAEPEGCVKALASYKGQSFGALKEDDKFFSDLLDGQFRKCFLFIFARNVEGTMLSNGYRERLARQMGEKDGLDTFSKQLSACSVQAKSRWLVECYDHRVRMHIGAEVMPEIDSPELCTSFLSK